MLSVREARERILAHISRLEAIFCPLEEAAGRVLAETISSPTDLPAFDNSGVDGFAVRAQDTAVAPVALPVIADIPAGSAPDFTLQPGQAARIMTGAPLPDGADAVVMVEETDFGQQSAGTPAPVRVTIQKTIQPGANVRYRGADLRAGTKILPAGHLLRPQDVGMLAMLGMAQVPVVRKPRVAILSSGDELLSVEAPLQPGKIRDTNTYTLAALVAQAGGEPLRLGVAADRREAVQSLLDQALEARADVIVSSAGVSVGAFDFVKDVVESAGVLDFWKVNMRPGKPLAFGAYKGIPFFGLPGNPVSAFVGFLVFVRPALQRMAGLNATDQETVRVVLAETVESDGRESYLRAVVKREQGVLAARLTGHQGSGNLFSLVQANALLIIPSGVKSCPLGTEVEAWLLET
ncbi:MAG: molybdopterin molybdotransferase MoeA [Anaerolineales bacterium]|nr:molybdopterin molybdotransferase MoeA [Anaerolineales bacterium]MCX7755746.1 molybdopterin molybdotransferase MoeA [Anaerolineales bacterium]MDW8277654.1 molybdopterin molybdotransferase MoeA [Anaerolineales bacterium]